MMAARFVHLLCVAAAAALAAAAATNVATASGQPPTQVRPPVVRPQAAPPPPGVERLSGTSFRVGQLLVDTAKREVTAPATVNDVTLLEFVANTRNGFKAYESALTIDTNAINFNAALLLIGLDPSRSRVPTRHFDPIPPSGDPIDIFVEWTADGTLRRIRVEELLFDKRTSAPLPEGPWVYTGSTFVDNRYLADIDGVLIGFVHSPAPIIENPRAGAVGAYGFVVMNPRVALPPGRRVTVIVKALDRAGGDR